MLERYGKIIGGVLGGAIVMGVIWGFATDWNFTTSAVLASNKNPDISSPKEGDSCLTDDGKTGIVRNGTCTA